MTKLLGDVTSQATSYVSMARNPTMRKSGSKNLSLKAQLISFKQVPVRQKRGKQENTRWTQVESNESRQRFRTRSPDGQPQQQPNKDRYGKICHEGWRKMLLKRATRTFKEIKNTGYEMEGRVRMLFCLWFRNTGSSGMGASRRGRRRQERRSLSRCHSICQWNS